MAWVNYPRLILVRFPIARFVEQSQLRSGGNAWSVGGEYEVSPSGSVSPEANFYL